MTTKLIKPSAAAMLAAIRDDKSDFAAVVRAEAAAGSENPLRSAVKKAPALYNQWRAFPNGRAVKVATAAAPGAKKVFVPNRTSPAFVPVPNPPPAVPDEDRTTYYKFAQLRSDKIRLGMNAGRATMEAKAKHPRGYTIAREHNLI